MSEQRDLFRDPAGAERRIEVTPPIDPPAGKRPPIETPFLDGLEIEPDLPEGGGTGGSDGGDGTPPGWREDGHLRRLIDSNFIQYAAYVIRDRAIPDLVDGLKPVQRRILHSLNEKDDGKFTKVANVVGHTMQYHPHGDASIADALVALTNKGYLIEGQGNFGNTFTGDPAAASRYIECRLTELARKELFNDELTRFVPSYDGRRQEPVTLPAKLPLLLMMGAEGIAVGLSTKVLPHNFVELLRAQIAIIEKKPFEVLPDFRQGGLMDASEYDLGNGRIRLRAEIEAVKENALAIRSVPYGTTTDSLITSIETAIKKKKLGIRSIDDFTAESVEIQVVLKPGQDPEKAIQALYAFSACEVQLSSRIVVIHKNRPLELDVEKVLRHNTRQLVRTLRRELEAERRNLLDQVHHKTLIQIFVENRIYKRIEECKTFADVQQAVLDGVNEHRELLLRDVNTKDVQTLLGIPIKRISRYDMNKNRDEISSLLTNVSQVEANLAELNAYAVRYLKGLIRKYGADYPRRTKSVRFDNIEVRELTATELTLCYDAKKGYLGHSVTGEERFQCSSLDRVLVLRADGVFTVVQPPEKLFVDVALPYCGIAVRDRIFVVVYRDPDGLHYVKRFSLGGTILNREYRYAPSGATVIFASEENPDVLYVKYRTSNGVRPSPQCFDLSPVQVRGAKTRGTLVTAKEIESVHDTKPRGWNDRRAGKPGSLLNF